MSCKPQIEVNDGAGGYPLHTVEVINRMGEPGDEHLNVRIIECDARPEVVGRTYRMPAEGHNASAAPHIKDELARLGIASKVATVATPKRPTKACDRLREACEASGRAIVMFRAGSPPQLRRVGFQFVDGIAAESRYQIVNLQSMEPFCSVRIAGEWWAADHQHPAVEELLRSLLSEEGGQYQIVDVVAAP